ELRAREGARAVRSEVSRSALALRARGGRGFSTHRPLTKCSSSSQTSGQTRFLAAVAASSPAVLASSLPTLRLACLTKFLNADRLRSPQTPSASPLKHPTLLSSCCKARTRLLLSAGGGVAGAGMGGGGGAMATCCFFSSAILARANSP